MEPIKLSNNPEHVKKRFIYKSNKSNQYLWEAWRMPVEQGLIDYQYFKNFNRPPMVR